MLGLLAYAPGVTDFGDNLKRLRDRAGLTQEAVAEKMKLKRPTPISLWEGPRKGTVPKVSTIKRLAKAVACEPWELLDGVDTEYDKLRRRDLPDHNSKGSSPAAKPQQRILIDDAAEAASSRRLVAELTVKYDALLRAVSNAAGHLDRVVADAKTHRPTGATRTGHTGGTGRNRKVG